MAKQSISGNDDLLRKRKPVRNDESEEGSDGNTNTTQSMVLAPREKLTLTAHRIPEWDWVKIPKKCYTVRSTVKEKKSIKKKILDFTRPQETRTGSPGETFHGGHTRQIYQ